MRPKSGLEPDDLQRIRFPVLTHGDVQHLTDFIPIVMAYEGWSYYIFRNRVKTDKHHLVY